MDDRSEGEIGPNIGLNDSAGEIKLGGKGPSKSRY